MRGVSRFYGRGVAAAFLCAIVFSFNVLAADVRPRDPSFGGRVRAWLSHVVRTLSDNIWIPPA